MTQEVAVTEEIITIEMIEGNNGVKNIQIMTIEGVGILHQTETLNTIILLIKDKITTIQHHGKLKHHNQSNEEIEMMLKIVYQNYGPCDSRVDRLQPDRTHEEMIHHQPHHEITQKMMIHLMNYIKILIIKSVQQ